MPLEQHGLSSGWSYLRYPSGLVAGVQELSSAGLFGQICSLGFEHPIFWAEKEAELADEVQGEGAGDAAVFGQCTGGGASKSVPAADRIPLVNPFGAAVVTLQTVPFCGVGRSLLCDLLARGPAFPYSMLAPL